MYCVANCNILLFKTNVFIVLVGLLFLTICFPSKHYQYSSILKRNINGPYLLSKAVFLTFYFC